MKAIFPGSFDPVTKGHLDLISRAAALCEELVVAVLVNPDKQGLFTAEERLSMLREACAGLPNVTFVRFSGLLADLARETGIRLVIRGVRTAADLDAELAMAGANKTLLPGLETVLLPAAPEVSGISSSLVRQIASFGGDLDPFVPQSAAEALRRRYDKTEKKQ